MNRKIEFASLEYHNDNYLYLDGENQMARTTVEQQLAKLKKQKAALEKKEQELLDRSNNKDLIKIVALIRKAGLTAADITKAMKGSKRTVRAKASKLAGVKVEPKYRNPKDKTQTWTGRGRAPVWAAALKKAGKLDSVLIRA
jgi:DNA-binding protein H-NS